MKQTTPTAEAVLAPDITIRLRNLKLVTIAVAIVNFLMASRWYYKITQLKRPDILHIGVAYDLLVAVVIIMTIGSAFLIANTAKDPEVRAQKIYGAWRLFLAILVIFMIVTLALGSIFTEYLLQNPK